MADIPLISITKECSDDDDLSTSSAVNKPNIEDALTDTEDLIMDPAHREKKSSPATPIPAVSKKATLLDALESATSGAVTDVEDCSDTSDEEDGDKKCAREVEISLDDFLDQGFVDEMTKSNQGGAKPKILTRSCSKATTEPSVGRSLQVCVDSTAALTDCEDCAMSEDECESAIPDCPEDILMKADEDNGTVDIHNAVRRRQEKHVPRAEPVQSSSSDSDEPECKVVRHRKPHRKAVAPENRNTSDCENIVVSDDESGACARPRSESMFEADEITMEGSDRENDQSTVFPEINISFVTDEASGEPSGKKKAPSVSRPSTLSVGHPNPEDAVTDVENLDSSDSDTDAPHQTKRLMPRAVARGGKGGGGGLTDVEDFNASDEDNDNDDSNHLNMGGEDHSFLPSPTREISIMRGDGSGEQTANVMPLNQSCLLVKTPDIEQQLTDFEDLAVNDDEEQMYDDSKYTIESLPEMDNDNVYASENTPVAPKQHWVEKVHDPVTDTEDICLDRRQEKTCPATVTFGSGELRRRRKPKSTEGGAPSYKGKTFLDTSATGAQENGSATTDVEDLYLSDEDDGCTVTSDRAKQRRATIQVPPKQNAECAKTDIEYLSGDEYVSERTVPSPTVCPDGFRSTVKSRERTGGLFGGSPDDFHCQMPIIRKVSPSPDACNCTTDCEEIQGGSEEDDGATKLDVDGEDSYSRAQTATPLELRRALDESGSSEIHDALVGPPKRMHVDERRGYPNDGQEMPTDVEYLDDDPAEVAPQAE